MWREWEEVGIFTFLQTYDMKADVFLCDFFEEKD